MHCKILYHDVHLKIVCIRDVLEGDLSNSLTWDLVLSLNDVVLPTSRKNSFNLRPHIEKLFVSVY